MKVISDEIKRITEIIVAEYQPNKVIIFRSRARGDNKPDSDIDILVISMSERNLS